MAREIGLDRAIRGELRVRSRDAAAAEVAGRQHGVVSRSQLRALGLSDDAIDRRLAAGRLHRVHRAVYAVGHVALTQRARWMAATLLGATLSHRSAAALWAMSSSTRVEVTAARERAHPRVTFHLGRLRPDEVITLDHIPVTTPHRTLLDLATVAPRNQLARAMHECQVLRLPDTVSLAALLARYPGRGGTAVLRRLLAEDAQHGPDSELERRFLALVVDAGLPAPRRNVLLEGLECDCAWPDHRLVVELDGKATHATSRAFERDRTRDRALAVAGWTVIRVTWRELHRERSRLLADLRALLSAGAPGPPGAPACH